MTATTDPAGTAAPLEMDPDIRARWVAALRSGEYEQGREMLRTPDDRFCCMGVLCELAVMDGVLAPAALDDSGDWLYDGEEAYPPEAVRDWAGLSTGNPVVKVQGQSGPWPLAILNDHGGDDDDSGWTFAQIADVIEGGAR